MSAPDPQPARRLKILVVEDDRPTLLLLTACIARMGHEARTAVNGLEAVKAVAEERPDIVIADLMMPVMDGLEATKRIKNLAGGQWLPVLVLTAKDEDRALVGALDCGADDYLVKPVGFPLLAAKVRGLAHMIELQRQLHDRSRELAAYRDGEERDTGVAVHVMSRLVNRDLLNDPALRHWICPARRFSGDLIAAARTPAGALHVLLADAAGHGLSAALNALPVAQCFYSMTAKGFAIGGIAEEMNRKIRHLLPIERFVAATLIAVDFRQQWVGVWNGGNPTLVALGAGGELLFAAPSRHLPLGLAADHLFTDGIDTYRYDEPCQLIACSDGLVEMPGAGGGMLGPEGLVSLLRAAAPEARLESVQACVRSAATVASPTDDISVAIVECGSLADASRAAALATGKVVRAEPGARQISLSAEELKYVVVAPLLLDLVRGVAGAEHHREKVFLILSELFNNALDHGLLRLDSRIKLEAGGFERYLELRSRGLERLAEAAIDIRIEIVRVSERPMLRIVFKDSGCGFDYANLLQAPPPATAPYGHGIPLLRKLCHSVEYRGSGSEAAVLYDLARSEAEG